MSNFGYFKLPRSLLTDPLWKGLSYAYRHIYLTILANIVFEPTTQDDFGVLVNLMPGQFMTTERELVRLCDEPDIDKSLIHRALEKFKKINFSNQTSNHKKTIITITRTDICELIKPNFEPNSNQTRTIKEESKERKEEIYISRFAVDSPKIFPLNSESQEDTSASDNINYGPLPDESVKNKIQFCQSNSLSQIPSKKPIQDSKIQYRDNVYLKPEDYEKLISNHGLIAVEWMLDKLSNQKYSSGRNYKSDYHAILNWVIDAYLKNNASTPKASNSSTTDIRRIRDKEGNFVKNPYAGIF